MSCGPPASSVSSVSSLLAAVWAQTPADAKRLRQAGAQVQAVFGNLKFDAAPDAALPHTDAAKDAKAGDLTFSHLRITYAERNVQKKSDFYLAPYRGRLLKIRLTADEPIDDDSLARAFAEAAAGFAGKS